MLQLVCIQVIADLLLPNVTALLRRYSVVVFSLARRVGSCTRVGSCDTHYITRNGSDEWIYSKIALDMANVDVC